MNSTIEKIHSREILDSRGNPTIEVDVILKCGLISRSSVPSGASTGEYEANELRDNDQKRFMGKGVLNGVKNINTTIFNILKGENVLNQNKIDQIMIDCDGTENKSNLGANSILGVSLAVAHAGAKFLNIPLYEYLNEKKQFLLPLPMMNILNGGSHANNNLDIQEFMILPFNASSFSEALRIGTEIFHHLKSILNDKGLNTSVGDEGGFAPNLSSHTQALELIMKAIESAKYRPGEDVFIALDVAASELYINGKYNLKSEKRFFNSKEMIEYYKSMISKFPIISIEDGLDENDWENWNHMTKELGSKIQIVGDDLTVTNQKRLRKAINNKSMNSILIKLNQIGTITETIKAIDMAKNAGFGAIISHRSGETEDTTIADFSVAMGMGQIKTGSASRTDRICKYNQLLRIEESLGKKSQLASINVLGKS